jgi:hypothetical protein
MVLRAVSFDVDLDAQQNDEPAKDSRSLAPPECRFAIAIRLILLLIEPMRCLHSVLSREWRDGTALFVGRVLL